MGGAIENLGRALSPALALKLASSLEIDGSLPKALAKLPEGDVAVSTWLAGSFASLGPADLADVLRGLASSAAAQHMDVRAVWSGPTFAGDGDHTTAALSHVIDDANEDVFASTYSADLGSEFVKALWRAVARGVRTTVLLDASINHGKTAADLAGKLYGARVLVYRPDGTKYAVQHSKVLVVDSRVAFVTSANFSIAAAERNLEAGVLIRDAGFASTMRQRFAALTAAGALADYDG